MTKRAGVSVPDRRVALLRGVNVGGAKRVAMADLRRLMDGLGYTDVRTLLNSGNVVFTAPSRRSGDGAARIEQAIEATLGVASRVTVLTGQEVATAVRDNPFAGVADDPSRLLMLASPEPKALALLKPLLKEPWAPEAVALGPRVAYLWCARGVAESRLWPTVNRALGEVCTARNMATMVKLLALVEGA
jgi:uncharacterized protein (DUF1697 family)